jgi:hypothetical protein
MTAVADSERILYTPRHGEIFKLASRKFKCGEHFYTLPTHFPATRFGRDVWIIHSFLYWASGKTDEDYMTEGFAVDNYGNFYCYTYYTTSFTDWKEPTMGSANFKYPLSDAQINTIKRIGDYMISDSSAKMLSNNIKVIAKVIYLTKQTQEKLNKERARTEALEEELRTLRAMISPPPTEDLLGLNI